MRRVLLSCQYSTRLRDTLRAKGYDAWTNDIIECEGNPEFHICADAVEVAYSQHWDDMIAMPPCTYFTLSGVRWFYDERPQHADRLQRMDEAAEFYKSLRAAPIERKALENPKWHKFAMDAIGVTNEQRQFIHPWQFGHGEQKPTGLDLIGFPELTPTNIVTGREQKIWRMAPGPNRQKERSRSYDGIMDAISEQWF